MKNLMFCNNSIMGYNYVMSEILPVGQGYASEKLLLARIPQIQQDGTPRNEFMGYESMKEMLSPIPQNGIVCDVGCVYAAFAREVHDIRRDLRVCSINPAFSMYTFRKGPIEYKKNLLAGLSPELPFKNGSFDATFDIYASWYYSNGWTEHMYALDELLRITKHGDKVYFGPFGTEDKMLLAEIEQTFKRIRRIKNVQKQQHNTDDYFYDLNV